MQYLVYMILYVIVFALSVWALVDLLTRPARAFISAGKRTKGFWGAMLAAAVAVSFVALPYPLGIGRLGFLALAAAVAAIVYLVDVKPALQHYSGRGGRGSRGSGRGPSSRGGW